MKTPLRILHLADNANDVELVKQSLAADGISFEMELVQTRDSFLAALERGGFDLVIGDCALPSFDGIAALAVVREKHKYLPFILVSETIGEHIAVEALKSGATDYVTKSRMSRLGAAVRRALREVEERGERHRAQHALQESEEALRKSEEQYRRLFEESKDAVFISTLDGRFLDINPAGLELFGYSSKEEMQQIDIVRDLYWFPGDREPYIQLLTTQGYVKDYEETLKRKDGQRLIVLQTSTAVRDEGGKIVTYRGILRDVTHLKALQEQLLRSQKMEAIGQLAGGVAHDFNNIMMAVGSYAELLLMKMSENDPHRSEVLEIERAILQGANLTKQLLAFGRRQILSPKILDMNQSVSKIENMIQRFIGEHIEMETCFEQDLGQVEADPGQIEQILINMAVNARDAMPGGGKLTIETANQEFDNAYAKQHPDVKPGRYVMLAISDTGCGMDDETSSRIFEPFFTTKEEGKGTGLGLSTVYGIVKQSGGHIFVYSQLGRGTSFKIYFPRVDRPAEMEPAPYSGYLAAGGNETILLVDDNESVRSAIGAFLEMTGYTVYQADHGRMAIELTGQHPEAIHLLITDVIMPGMNGWELAESLTAVRPDLKILYMSGFSEEAIRRKALRGPDTAFLSKPATMESLLKKIRGMLG